MWYNIQKYFLYKKLQVKGWDGNDYVQKLYN